MGAALPNRAAKAETFTLPIPNQKAALTMANIETDHEEIEHGDLVRRKRLLLTALRVWELKNGINQPNHDRLNPLGLPRRKRKP